MENMSKHEYMDSMNVKTSMLFRFGKKKAFTHTDKKKKRRPTLIFFSKQTYFFYALIVE